MSWSAVAVAERGRCSITAISPKISPGPKLGKDAPGAGADEAGNFHQPVFDKINAIAGIVFAENLTAGGEMPFLGDKTQCLQFIAAQIAEQSRWIPARPQPAL